MFTFTLYAVAAVLAGWASSHVLKAAVLVKVWVPPPVVPPPPPESEHAMSVNESERMSENVRIDMNLCREIGGGGGSYFVSCHGVYGYSLSLKDLRTHTSRIGEY
jgi:hypothetical protein